MMILLKNRPAGQSAGRFDLQFYRKKAVVLGASGKSRSCISIFGLSRTTVYKYIGLLEG